MLKRALSRNPLPLFFTTILLAGLACIPTAKAAPGFLTFIEAQYDDAGLNGAISVTVSPHGSHVYVASFVDDAVMVFSRNASHGKLSYVEVHKDTDPSVDGLDGAISVAVSPHGSHVYVAGAADDAVAVFERDETSGALTFVEVHKDTDPSVDGLDNASSVTVSPDGSHVYVAGYLDDAVAVFERNETSGALTFVEVHKDTDPGVDGLDGAWAVTVSPDGNHVYVAGSEDDAVAVFSRNASDGKLTFVEVHKDTDPGVDGLDGAWAVTVSPDGNHVYVAGLYDDAVAVFSRNASDGKLTFVEVQKDTDLGVDGLDGAASVTVSPDENHVYVAGLYDDAVAVFSRNASDGKLTFVEVQKDGVGGVDGLDGAASVAVSPDGSHVYVAGDEDDAVAVFDRDGTSGALSYVEMQQNVDGLDGAWSVAFSPDGSHVYVAGSEDDAVTVFSRSRTSGELTFVEMQKDGWMLVDGLNGAASVAVSPDGSHVYVTGNSDNAVAVFDRDASDGRLTFVEVQKDGVGGVDGLWGAYSVAVSPDGSHVYVTGYSENAVAVFDRDDTSGALTFVEVQKDGVGGVDGLGAARSVAISPNGSHVYVAGQGDDAVAVFSRNASDGRLTFVDVHKDTDPGVDGLDGAYSIAFSSDGGHVYVAGFYDNAVAVFSRNASDGKLTFVEVHKDGAGGVDGLWSAVSVAVSPSGSHVYVAGYSDNAVAVFSRDASDGRLTFVEMQKDGIGGVDGLYGAISVAVSPDEHHLCAAGSADDAVVVFGLPPIIYLPIIMRNY